jgi:hypothetical protein
VRHAPVIADAGTEENDPNGHMAGRKSGQTGLPGNYLDPWGTGNWAVHCWVYNGKIIILLSKPEPVIGSSEIAVRHDCLLEGL